MKFFAKGKRGRIYLDKRGGNFVCVKKADENRIRNEVYWLRILNEHKIGPKLIDYDKNSFCYNFIEGEFILDYLKNKNKDVVKDIVIKILKQCRTLDKLKVNKFELHKPIKHIIIKNKNPIMIDFERCRESLFPKNVTQFCQFLTSKNFENILKINKKKMIKLLKEYKREENNKNFKNIMGVVKNP